ncbi:hypothetical protein UPYG_G00060430 [Umbra pygmaea]|uniref:Ig-like domain-containing protein n=1 Tax=Umbra pygmaea TaxID=75934 RepID=A0ABD0XCK1_UMBPY
MSLKTTGTVVVFLWSVTVFLGQDGGSLENPTQSTCVKVVEKGKPSPGWNVTYTPMSICALKGSTVNLSCSYKYPSGTVTSTFWFTKCNNSLYINLMNDSDYTGRMNYSSNQMNTNTLTITDLRLNDSVIYWFRFKTNQTGGKWTGKHGVTLSVTGLQVDVTSESTPKTLNCNTTCTLPGNPTYIWYKNGQHINESTSPQYKYSVYSNYGDSYYCAVKGHEDLHSPVVYGPKKTSVSVSPSGEIVEGSSVSLTCSSDANPPVDKYTWYFKNKLLLNGSGQIYNISNISSEDSGPYICEAHNRIGSENSTALMIFRSGKVFKIMLFTGENGKQSPVITAAVGVTVFVLVLICFSGFMCFRQGRKNSLHIRLFSGKKHQRHSRLWTGRLQSCV